MIHQHYLEEGLTWRRASDQHYPYETEINGDRLTIRVNDFPEENLYTLLVNHKEVASFDDWPERWLK